MDRHSFLSIPPELQDHIVSYATRPSDLKNLCLTCKQLRTLATPKLYKTVALDLQSPELEEEDSGFLTIDHPGHKHVRHLFLFSSIPIGSHSDCTQFCQENMKRVLNVLPWHKLETFAAPGQMDFDGPTFSMLCSQQQALTSLSIGPIRQRMPSTIAKPREAFKQLTALSLPEDAGEVDLALYSHLIQNAPGLTHLAINGAQFTESPDLASTYRTLLGLHSRGQSKPRRLKTLSLYWLDFDDIGRFTTDMVEVESLVDLKLGFSPCLTSFLDAMADRFRETTPRLRGLEIVGTKSPSDLRALEKLLTSFSGLRYLKVSSEDDTHGFKLSSLASHASTLTDVYLALSELKAGKPRILRENELPDFFALHSKIRQIAIGFPKICGSQILGRNMRMTKFDEYLGYINCLPDLQILRILVQPIPTFFDEDGIVRDDASSEETARAKDAVADFVVKYLVGKNGHSKLKMVCIGQAEYLPDSLSRGRFPCEKPNYTCYCPGVQRDCFGREQQVSIFREGHLIKYDLPLWDAVMNLGASGSYDNGLGLGDYKRPKIFQ